MFSLDDICLRCSLVVLLCTTTLAAPGGFGSFAGSSASAFSSANSNAQAGSIASAVSSAHAVSSANSFAAGSVPTNDRDGANHGLTHHPSISAGTGSYVGYGHNNQNFDKFGLMHHHVPGSKGNYNDDKSVEPCSSSQDKEDKWEEQSDYDEHSEEKDEESDQEQDSDSSYDDGQYRPEHHYYGHANNKHNKHTASGIHKIGDNHPYDHNQGNVHSPHLTHVNKQTGTGHANTGIPGSVAPPNLSSHNKDEGSSGGTISATDGNTNVDSSSGTNAGCSGTEPGSNCGTSNTGSEQGPTKLGPSDVIPTPNVQILEKDIRRDTVGCGSNLNGNCANTKPSGGGQYPSLSGAGNKPLYNQPGTGQGTGIGYKPPAYDQQTTGQWPQIHGSTGLHNKDEGSSGGTISATGGNTNVDSTGGSNTGCSGTGPGSNCGTGSDHGPTKVEPTDGGQTPNVPLSGTNIGRDTVGCGSNLNGNCANTKPSGGGQYPSLSGAGNKPLYNQPGTGQGTGIGYKQPAYDQQTTGQWPNIHGSTGLPNKDGGSSGGTISATGGNTNVDSTSGSNTGCSGTGPGSNCGTGSDHSPTKVEPVDGGQTPNVPLSLTDIGRDTAGCGSNLNGNCANTKPSGVGQYPSLSGAGNKPLYNQPGTGQGTGIGYKQPAYDQQTTGQWPNIHGSTGLHNKDGGLSGGTISAIGGNTNVDSAGGSSTGCSGTGPGSNCGTGSDHGPTKVQPTDGGQTHNVPLSGTYVGRDTIGCGNNLNGNCANSKPSGIGQYPSLSGAGNKPPFNQPGTGQGTGTGYKPPAYDQQTTGQWPNIHGSTGLLNKDGGSSGGTISAPGGKTNVDSTGGSSTGCSGTGPGSNCGTGSDHGPTKVQPTDGGQTHNVPFSGTNIGRDTVGCGSNLNGNCANTKPSGVGQYPSLSGAGNKPPFNQPGTGHGTGIGYKPPAYDQQTTGQWPQIHGSTGLHNKDEGSSGGTISATGGNANVDSTGGSNTGCSGTGPGSNCGTGSDHGPTKVEPVDGGQTPNVPLSLTDIGRDTAGCGSNLNGNCANTKPSGGGQYPSLSGAGNKPLYNQPGTGQGTGIGYKQPAYDQQTTGQWPNIHGSTGLHNKDEGSSGGTISATGGNTNVDSTGGSNAGCSGTGPGSNCGTGSHHGPIKVEPTDGGQTPNVPLSLTNIGRDTIGCGNNLNGNCANSKPSGIGQYPSLSGAGNKPPFNQPGTGPGTGTGYKPPAFNQQTAGQWPKIHGSTGLHNKDGGSSGGTISATGGNANVDSTSGSNTGCSGTGLGSNCGTGSDHGPTKVEPTDGGQTPNVPLSGTNIGRDTVGCGSNLNGNCANSKPSGIGQYPSLSGAGNKPLFNQPGVGQGTGIGYKQPAYDQQTTGQWPNIHGSTGLPNKDGGSSGGTISAPGGKTNVDSTGGSSTGCSGTGPGSNCGASSTGSDHGPTKVEPVDGAQTPNVPLYGTNIGRDTIGCGNNLNGNCANSKPSGIGQYPSLSGAGNKPPYSQPGVGQGTGVKQPIGSGNCGTFGSYPCTSNAGYPGSTGTTGVSIGQDNQGQMHTGNVDDGHVDKNIYQVNAENPFLYGQSKVPSLIHTTSSPVQVPSHIIGTVGTTVKPIGLGNPFLDGTLDISNTHGVQNINTDKSDHNKVVTTTESSHKPISAGNPFLMHGHKHTKGDSPIYNIAIPIGGTQPSSTSPLFTTTVKPIGLANPFFQPSEKRATDNLSQDGHSSGGKEDKHADSGSGVIYPANPVQSNPTDKDSTHYPKVGNAEIDVPTSEVHKNINPGVKGGAHRENIANSNAGVLATGNVIKPNIPGAHNGYDNAGVNGGSLTGNINNPINSLSNVPGSYDDKITSQTSGSQGNNNDKGTSEPNVLSNGINANNQYNPLVANGGALSFASSSAIANPVANTGANTGANAGAISGSHAGSYSSAFSSSQASSSSFASSQSGSYTASGDLSGVMPQGKGAWGFGVPGNVNVNSAWSNAASQASSFAANSSGRWSGSHPVDVKGR